METREMLVLGDEPDAVPRARRFATEVVEASAFADLGLDVELVVSELVTNAVLHAGVPVRLSVTVGPEAVRIDVRDSSRALPVRPLQSEDAMTGRGLALVTALTRQWGVEAVDDGKVVWAEVGPGGQGDVAQTELDVDALLAAWGDDDSDGRSVHTVRLGDVPTDLLISAKAHVDNLVREFTLAASGAMSGTSAAVPLPLAQLIEAVVHRFAEARHEIKRQAIEAANRGDVRTTLTLSLSEKSIDAGRAYLDALDQADNYARAARLLTLETPAQHKVFRRWYVESLIEQLTAAVGGQPLPETPTFEDRLLAELGELSAAKYVADRAARLQEVTSSLAKATTVEHVAQVVLSEGVAVLGAAGGILLTASREQRLAAVSSVGYTDERLSLLLDAPPGEALPAPAQLRAFEAEWIESVQERDDSYPALVALEPHVSALCAVPLLLGDEVVGVLRFTFGTNRIFDADERRFVAALAAQGAQALVRAALYGAERQARRAAEDIADRLARLQVATAAFGAAVSVPQIADILVNHAADALGAEYASLWSVEGDELTVVRSRGLDADVERRWSSVPIASATPVAECVRIDDVVVLRPGDDVAARFPGIAAESRPGDGRTYVSVPLTVAGATIGAISLSFPADYDLDDRSSMRFLRTLADACGQALVRTRAQEEARLSGERLAFLAEASAVLSSSLDYRATLGTIADLVVPRLADWCSVQVVEGGAFSTVAVAHVDSAKLSAALEFQSRYPLDMDAPAGAPAVVRTGVSELTPAVTEEMLQAADLDAERLAFVRELGLSSVLTVPLTGRTGTFGVLSLVYAESGRHYGPGDVSYIEDLARRCAVAVENAEAYSAQSGQLLRVSRVAEVTQHAILPPVPARIRDVRLATRYVSATREALIGGDLYEAAEHEGGVRLIVGDVRGKGVDAVRLATVVLGEFRSAAARFPDVASMAAHMDERLMTYIGDEDFVTALLADIRPDGTCSLVSCGHPAAYLAIDGDVTLLETAAALPLGLGARPVALELQLSAGARILLYTDGLVEARTAEGRFVDADAVVAPLATAPFEDVLDAVLERLHVAAATGVADDMALLVAEFSPK